MRKQEFSAGSIRSTFVSLLARSLFFSGSVGQRPSRKAPAQVAPEPELLIINELPQQSAAGTRSPDPDSSAERLGRLSVAGDVATTGTFHSQEG
jgi:hypothetical protein